MNSDNKNLSCNSPRMSAFKAAMKWHKDKTGVTQKQIGKATGVSQAHINKILNTDGNWGSEDVRFKIVRFLSPGTTHEDFLDFGRALLDMAPNVEDAVLDNRPPTDIEFAFLKDYRKLDDEDRAELNRMKERMLELKRLKDRDENK